MELKLIKGNITVLQGISLSENNVCAQDYGYHTLPMAVNFFLAHWLLLWVCVSCQQVDSQLISKKFPQSLFLILSFPLVIWQTRKPIQNPEQSPVLGKKYHGHRHMLPSYWNKNHITPTIYKTSLEIPASGDTMYNQQREPSVDCTVESLPKSNGLKEALWSGISSLQSVGPVQSAHTWCVSRMETVKLWIFLVRHALPSILQPPLWPVILSLLIWVCNFWCRTAFL